MLINDISDDLLFRLYLEKNQDAIDMLFERYKVFIYGIIVDMQKHYGVFLEFEELYQDAMVAFLSCLEKYDEDNGCFYFFMKRAIERKLADRIKKTKKCCRYISLDVSMYEDSDETYIDYVAEDDKTCLYNTELYDRLVDRVDYLSKGIIDLRLHGYGYQEIAKCLGASKQGIYRRVAKIKNILKDIIEKID